MYDLRISFLLICMHLPTAGATMILLLISMAIFKMRTYIKMQVQLSLYLIILPDEFVARLFLPAGNI